MIKQVFKKNLISIFAALAIVFGMLPSQILAASGTEDNPYLIGDAADLKAFRDKANAEASSTLCAKLTSDIDLNNEEWTAFAPSSGYVTEAYAGVFDGDGHEIKGLYINSSSSNQGLFGLINGAVIKNLKVSGSVTSSNNYVGGIVGKVQQGTIENCSFSGDVSTSKNNGYAGGIVGYAGNSATQTAKLSGCVNKASVSGGYAGGVVGYAKYTEISNCYNIGSISGSTRSGGIAGQLQNNCSAVNCYNIGDVSGSGTASDICDFLYSSSTLTNCYYKTRVSGAGTGKTENCDIIAEGLLEKLGSDFAADKDNINNGYPILAWQAGEVSVPKNPHISINGSAVLYMTNSGAAPSSTLTVKYEDMESEPTVEWSVKNDSDVVVLEKPTNAGNSNNIVIVKANKPGKAVVVASAAEGEYTAELEISVMPFVTTVEIEGSIAVGQTVYAHVNVLGGAEYDYDTYPELKVQWKYLTDEDYSAGNTGSSSYKDIAGATNREFKITEELEGKYLSFSLWYNGEDKVPGGSVKVVSADEGILKADRAALEIDSSDVRENKIISLPSFGKNGSAIKWESSDEGIINSENGAVTMPESGIAEVKLTASLSYGGFTAEKEFSVRVYSKEAIDEENENKLLYIQKAIASLGDYYKIYPVFGKDTNIIDILKGKFEENEYENVKASVKSIEEIYGGAGIDSNGEITYFYADPNSTPSVKMGSYDVTFNLTYEDASADLKVPVIIYWDAEKVKAVMNNEILDKITDISLTGEGSTTDAVTENLTLPKVVDGKMWAQISWTSSDENIIAVSKENQSTADTIFEPYIGVVRQGTEDEQVTLTATVTFMLTNDITGNEQPITLSKVFPVTVKALGADKIEVIKAGLEEKLDNGFKKAGLCNAVTGELLTAENGKYTVQNDIKIPATPDFGVDGKYYPVSISSSDENVVKTPDVNNAARVSVYRPAVGKADAKVTVTVSISDKDTNVKASKSFDITVPALTKDEIDAEKALMAKVKAAYFDGIKGENTQAENISRNLTPFAEVYEDNGELVWVRDSKDAVNHGIVPVAMDGWEELESWRLFKSSNPAAVAHENLLVSMQKNAKAVKISSALSSETLGRYGELYKADPIAYADYAELADLYYQEVEADLIIRGTTTKVNSMPIAVTETIDVYFSLKGSNSTLISKIKYTELDETTTVFDVFKKALDENGYTYKSRGSYVYSVTTPDGTTIEEMDEGPNSGWMYKVNGKIPDEIMGGCGLSDGDDVVVFFTNDFTKETEYTYGGGSMSGGNKNTAAGNPSEEKTDDKKENVSEAGAGKINNSEYSDIAGHWAENAIKYVSGKGLMQGVGDGKFAPDTKLSRAMFVTILYRMENEPETEKSKFSDVESGSWYEKAVAWANKNNIVSGVSEDEFAPHSDITREQMAAVIYRYAQYKGVETAVLSENLTHFTDEGEISEYAVSAMNWVVGQELILGTSETTLSPKDDTTRAQAAMIFMKLAEKL